MPFFVCFTCLFGLTLNFDSAMGLPFVITAPESFPFPAFMDRTVSRTAPLEMKYRTETSFPMFFRILATDRLIALDTTRGVLLLKAPSRSTIS